MTWSYWFCDTITGEKLQQVEPADGSWGRRLNTAESGSHTFSLGDRAITRSVWRDITTTWSRTFVQCWDDEPVYAGLVTGRPYNRDKQMLTVRHTDLRSIFLARFPFGEESYFDVDGIDPGYLAISGASLVSAAAIVLQEGITGPPGDADYTLPLVLPSLVESGSFSAVYENFNFRRVSDILDELQESDGGPDIEFSPRWTDDKLEWVTRAGDLTGGTFDFDLHTADSPVSSYQGNEDGLKQVTGVFGIGQGYGETMVVGGTPGAFPYIIPARDVAVPWKLVDDNARATALAYERVAKYRTPTDQPAIVVQASEVSPVDLVLGSTITVTDSDDPFLLDGPTTHRLIGLSGGVGGSLTLTLEEVAT